jgi:DNA-binding response OmpR family regulator
MQVLIAHRDAEIGEQLAQMVSDYTNHECDFVGSAPAAHDWGRRHARCNLLLVQLEAEDFDGLAVGAELSEIFPGLQTLFLPAYPAEEQRLKVADTKVFPEPIDGEALLNAIEQAETATAETPDLFHVADIIQMCCLSRRSGALQLVKENHSAILFLKHGVIVHAETSAGRGRDAFFEIASWRLIEFAYDRTVRPPVETVHEPWDQLLIGYFEKTRAPNDAAEEERRSA